MCFYFLLRLHTWHTFLFFIFRFKAFHLWGIKCCPTHDLFLLLPNVAQLLCSAGSNCMKQVHNVLLTLKERKSADGFFLFLTNVYNYTVKLSSLGLSGHDLCDPPIIALKWSCKMGEAPFSVQKQFRFSWVIAGQK